ncbi:MAG: YabP/YqfC family sporulation protein [Clostridia bacterium]|nr:YabP/YqfC family sporulation protein [Clostridia bacterium]
MSKSEKPRRLTKKQRFLRAVEIPISAVRLCVSDDIRAQIEGRTTILAYEENEVRLLAGRLKISFVGTDLQITQYDSERTVIEGLIQSVSYERG